jgi:hypothetical protein
VLPVLTWDAPMGPLSMGLPWTATRTLTGRKAGSSDEGRPESRLATSRAKATMNGQRVSSSKLIAWASPIPIGGAEALFRDFLTRTKSHC